MTKYTESSPEVQAQSSPTNEDEFPEKGTHNLWELQPQQFDELVKTIVKRLFSNQEPPPDIWSRILGHLK